MIIWLKRIIWFLLLLSLAGCEKAPEMDIESRESQSSSSPKKKKLPEPDRNQGSTEVILDRAISELSAAPLRSHSVDKYIKDVMDSMGVTRSQAASELYAALTKGKDRTAQLKAFTAFYPILFENIGDLSTVLGELPAGDLRRMAVSSLGRLTSSEMEKIYRAMPESSDRQKIANGIVSKIYFESGLTDAIDSIRTLDQPSEKVAATVHLSEKLSGSHSLHGTKIRIRDIQELSEFAAGLEMDDTSKILFSSSLNSISPSDK